MPDSPGNGRGSEHASVGSADGSVEPARSSHFRRYRDSHSWLCVPAFVVPLATFVHGLWSPAARRFA